MFKYVHRSEMLLRTQAFEWHHHFKVGRESTENSKSCDVPVTFRTDENIKKASVAMHTKR